jgi:hypothetical protein
MLQRTLTLRSVRRSGVCHVVQPTRQTFGQKSESSYGTKKRGSAENEPYDQREEAA